MDDVLKEVKILREEIHELKDLLIPEAEPEQEEIDDAVRDLNDHAQVVHRELHFSIDKDSGHTVIKVIDAKTDEVIRQIPGEEALKVAQRLSEGADLEIFNSYT